MVEPPRCQRGCREFKSRLPLSEDGHALRGRFLFLAGRTICALKRLLKAKNDFDLRCVYFESNP